MILKWGKLAFHHIMVRFTKNLYPRYNIILKGGIFLCLDLLQIAVIGSLGFAAYNYASVKRRNPGTESMREISAAIREGADAFIWLEFSVIVKVSLLLALTLGVFVSWYTGVAFLIGATMSQLVAFIGMDIATIANVRVSNAARETKSLGSTLKVAFQGGSVRACRLGDLPF